MVVIVLKLNGGLQNQGNEIKITLNSYKEESRLCYKRQRASPLITILVLQHKLEVIFRISAAQSYYYL